MPVYIEKMFVNAYICSWMTHGTFLGPAVLSIPSLDWDG